MIQKVALLHHIAFLEGVAQDLTFYKGCNFVLVNWFYRTGTADDHRYIAALCTGGGDGFCRIGRAEYGLHQNHRNDRNADDQGDNLLFFGHSAKLFRQAS